MGARGALNGDVDDAERDFRLGPATATSCQKCPSSTLPKAASLVLREIDWESPLEVYEINPALTPPYPPRGSTLP